MGQCKVDKELVKATILFEEWGTQKSINYAANLYPQRNFS